MILLNWTLDIALDIKLEIALDMDPVYNNFSKTPLNRSPGTNGSHPSPDSNANPSPSYSDNPQNGFRFRLR